MRYFTDGDIRRIVEAYRDGASLKDIGALYQADRRIISRVLKRHGVAIRRSGRPSTIDSLPDNADIVKEYRAGISVAEIARKRFYTPQTVWYRLKKLGVYSPKNNRRKICTTK